MLLKKGKLDSKAAEAWEEITKRNDAEHGGLTYSTMFDNFAELVDLISEYNEIRITLHSLLYKCNMVKVRRMKELGFKIDVTNSDTYKETLYNCIQNSKNYATKIQFQRNKIEAEMPKQEEGKETYTFHQLMANLTRHLGFNLPDDITLARYSAQVKELKQHGREQQRTDSEE